MSKGTLRRNFAALQHSQDFLEEFASYRKSLVFVVFFSINLSNMLLELFPRTPREISTGIFFLKPFLKILFSGIASKIYLGILRKIPLCVLEKKISKKIQISCMDFISEYVFKQSLFLEIAKEIHPIIHSGNLHYSDIVFICIT